MARHNLVGAAIVAVALAFAVLATIGAAVLLGTWFDALTHLGG